MASEQRDSRKREAKIRAAENGVKSLPVDVHRMVTVEQEHWRHGSAWQTLTLAAYYGCIVLREMRNKSPEIIHNFQHSATR